MKDVAIGDVRYTRREVPVGVTHRCGPTEDPRVTKPTCQSLQIRRARSASPKPLCDHYAKQKQPDKHQDILPTAITPQISRLAFMRLAQFGRHLMRSFA